jgi:arsenite methyltransferase
MQASLPSKDDKWSKWVVQTRFGNGKYAEGAFEALKRLRDTVLEKAQAKAGMTLLDVGAGDGLVAFGALDRLGPTGRVILADISEPLVERARAAAGQMDVLQQYSFVKASAEDLSAITDESVDIVTTRSVLIYVADKARAMREFYRVLKCGGRIALFETVHLPKLERAGEKWPGVGWGVFSSELLEPISDLVARYMEQLAPAKQAAASMAQSDHFDYLHLCEDVGFTGIEVELHLHSHKVKGKLETFMNQSPNPHFPTPAEHMGKIFTPEERQRFLDHMRPLVEQELGISRWGGVYISAQKPASAPDSPANAEKPASF